MVTRDNHTWEWVSQKLSSPLDSGVCYSFSVQLASSPIYESLARLTGGYANYNAPAVFQVWGGYDACVGRVLIAESPPVAHPNWRKYHFIVRHLHEKPLTHLMLVAYYPPGKRCTPAMGNLLVDDFSAITEIDCPSNRVGTLGKSFNLEIPQLNTETSLDIFLRRKLTAIRYKSRKNVKMEFQCVEGYQGLVEYQSTHLLAVAEAMRQFPGKKLVLRTKNASSKTLRERAVFLEKYLRSAALSENQFEVKPFDKNETTT